MNTNAFVFNKKLFLSVSSKGWVAETTGSNYPAAVSGALQFHVSAVALGRWKEELRRTEKKLLRILLQVIYLRTYLNAGVMQVFLDGKLVGTLDSLYPDFQSFKYSIAEPFSLVVEAERVPSELEIRWVPDNGSSAAVTACLGRMPSTDALAACRTAVAKARQPGHKVKVTNVLLCAVADSS